MITFTLGLVFGVAFGLLVMAFLNLAAYDRGFDAAIRRRATWIPAATRRAIAKRGMVPARRLARTVGA